MVYKGNMIVTYLDHSGFLVETKTAYFLFDYYKGEIPDLDRSKPIVVFVSHSHQDHYNREIYKLLLQYPDIQYVLAKDIPTKRLISEYNALGIDLGSHILSIRKNTIQSIPLWNGKPLEITTLKSTDAGVAFLLEYDNRTYYHAGDLNLWYWQEESKQYNENMTKKFLREMEKLKGKKIDVAFVPFDPRLGEHMMDGLRILMDYTESKWIFPMHMWGNYSVITECIRNHPEYREQIAKIEQEGQVFQRDDI